jgi:hypothetical protein
MCRWRSRNEVINTFISDTCVDGEVEMFRSTYRNLVCHEQLSDETNRQLLVGRNWR